MRPATHNPTTSPRSPTTSPRSHPCVDSGSKPLGISLMLLPKAQPTTQPDRRGFGGGRGQILPQPTPATHFFVQKTLAPQQSPLFKTHIPARLPAHALQDRLSLAVGCTGRSRWAARRRPSGPPSQPWSGFRTKERRDPHSPGHANPLVNLAFELASRGHHVTVVTTTRYNVPEYAQNSTIRFHTFQEPPSFSDNMAMISNLISQSSDMISNVLNTVKAVRMLVETLGSRPPFWSKDWRLQSLAQSISSSAMVLSAL
ncbi:uncharacterized protein BJ171DRAFT_508352 [Polychytrium aggregatum]|uniref:uncharacterized protein n=1 Tax=Polychytrium aggregatum TaxID=110093 RepID=UPI0022FE1F76|nr:uncharacterized protein BJ171DRAFT_508352 [Polychytrium aggregatum]KAI9203848.1 hypothetical protein BJ171DRAFT_508352 [Polychytrium aggregatum]